MISNCDCVVLSLVALLVALQGVNANTDHSQPDVGADEEPAPVVVSKYANAEFDAHPAKFVDYLNELAASNAAATTELADAVLASDLLALNQTKPEDCSRETLFKRKYVCDLAVEVSHVMRYCVERLDEATRFCANELLGKNVRKNCIARLLEERRRGKAMEPEYLKLWRPVLSLPKGNPMATYNYLFENLITSGNKKSKANRRVHNIWEGEKLTRQQLMRRLMKRESLKDKIIIAHLAMTKDKAGTEIVNGVTVRDLLEMNDVSERHCQPAEMHRRALTCFKTSVVVSARLHCRSALRSMAAACLEAIDNHYEGEVDSWWYGVYEGIMPHGGDLLKIFTPTIRTTLESYLAKDVDEARAALDERHRRAREGYPLEEEGEGEGEAPPEENGEQ